jgi:hypothetical protein
VRRFNTTVRGHLNYLEALPAVLAYQAIAGLFYARFTLAASIVFVVGRQLYAIGYKSKSRRCVAWLGLAWLWQVTH